MRLSVVLIGQNAMTFLQLNVPSISAPSLLASHSASAVNGFSERIAVNGFPERIERIFLNLKSLFPFNPFPLIR